MAELEKVVKGLEILENGCEYINCDDCCFYISAKPTRCGLREEQIQKEALELLKEQEEEIENLKQTCQSMMEGVCLLKEQEAVEPVTESSVYDPDTWFFVCGSCKKSVIERGDKFCRWCGRSVKWE